MTEACENKHYYDDSRVLILLLLVVLFLNEFREYHVTQVNGAGSEYIIEMKWRDQKSMERSWSEI